MKMMIWLVERDDCEYDEYDSFVVRAEDETEARELALTEAYSDPSRPRKDVKAMMVEDYQGWREARVTQVPVWRKPKVILGSFRAG